MSYFARVISVLASRKKKTRVFRPVRVSGASVPAHMSEWNLTISLITDSFHNCDLSLTCYEYYAYDAMMPQAALVRDIAAPFLC